MKHTWTDPVEEVSYTVTDDEHGLTILPDLLRSPLAREILRLAEEPARARRELLAWIVGREDLHKGNVALALLRELRAALDRIIPEEG